jgi:hypothetical protein
MVIKKIKIGQWYETSLGYGECTKTGGTFPPSCQVRIAWSIPRGTVTMRPRDIIRELSEREVAALKDRIGAPAAGKVSP